MLEKIKIALRISHNLLDDDIVATVNTARLEMVRAGITEEKANDEDDDLIVMAIKSFCLSVYCEDNKKAESYHASWLYQLDNLRKSAGYRKEV